MLTLVSRRALVLFLTSTIVILKGASAELDIKESTTTPIEERPCLDNPSYRFNRKEKKTCAWIGEKKQRKKKLCKKFQVKKNCPDTCGFDCNKKISRCPPNLPKSGSSCARFKEGLACDYHHRYTGTCDGYETDFGCNPLAWAKCEEDKWSIAMAKPEICPPSQIPPGSPLEDLPFGEKCKPKDCPLLPPVDKSSCSNYDGKETCGYNYGLFGCADDDKKCQAKDLYFCNRNDPTNHFWEYSAYQPMPCVESREQGIERCDPTACPAVEPRKGSSCADYEGKETCDYEYETFGCDEDSITCLATKSYRCNRQKKKWVPQPVFLPQCEAPSGLPVGLPCDPDDGAVLPSDLECPAEEPRAGRICKYKGKEACKYDYEIFGCGADSLHCVAMKHYKCKKERWFYTEPALPTCIAPPELPVGESCEPGVVVPTLPPVLDRCPKRKPEGGSECTGFKEGIECMYNYRVIGCPGAGQERPHCSPIEFYTCSEDVWNVAVHDPAPCEGGESAIGDRCDPNDPRPTLPPVSDKCPIKKPEGGSDCGGFMEGIECEYDFREIGCPGEEPTCSATEFHICSEGVWNVALVDPMPCAEGGDAIGKPCDPNAVIPTLRPTLAPTLPPTLRPTPPPTGPPTRLPTLKPTHLRPTQKPTLKPTRLKYKCPLREPDDESCAGFMEGITCEYDFREVGCAETEQRCVATKFYSCFKDVWRVEEVKPFPCAEGGNSFGKRCDPNAGLATLPPVSDKCPIKKPESQSDCTGFKEGIECEYEFRQIGCPGEEPTCSATEFHICSEGVWNVDVFMPMPCAERGDPIGKPCDPDVVLPTLPPVSDKCPIKKPESQSDCGGFKEGIECEYEFRQIGCPGEEPSCSATEFHICSEGVWNVAVMDPMPCVGGGDSFGKSCDPNLGIPTLPPSSGAVYECPVEEPEEGSLCKHVGDKTCQYGYKWFGCDADSLSCMAMRTYFCDEESKWSIVPIFLPPCEAPPETPVGESCEPGIDDPVTLPPILDKCPIKKPEGGSDCGGFLEGIDCEYEFRQIGCPGEEPQCSATEFYTCSEGVWIVAYTDPVPCIEGGDPIGNPCDPNIVLPTEPPVSDNCPLKEPDDESCAGFKEGIECEYDFREVGCSETEQKCVATKFYTCSKDVWTVAVLDPLPCPEGGDSFWEPCDPNDGPITLPPILDKCPERRPEKASDCSEYMDGLDCEYGYRLFDCPEAEQSCAPSKRFICRKNRWRAAKIDSLQCDVREGKWGRRCDPDDVVITLPPILEECPLKKPEGDSGCSEYMDGLNCEYGFHTIGCPETGFECSPTEFYTCSEDRWIVAIADIMVPCDDGSDPMGDECDPNDVVTLPPLDGECPTEKPESGDACFEPMDCDYDYRMIGCSEDELKCEPTQHFTCTGETWQEAVYDVIPCEDGSIPIGEQCDPNEVTLPPVEGGCPIEKPENGAECSMAMECNYDYQWIGCSEDETKCLPKVQFTCTGETWAMALYDFPPCKDGAEVMFGEVCLERDSC